MSFQPPQWGAPPTRESGSAIAALILGICGFIVCPLVCSIAAIVCANKAFTEIDDSGGRITGRGMAQAGQILGWIGIALCLLGLLAFVALFVFALGASESLEYSEPAMY
jgi:Domain of unknown function (DUF4190)